MSKKTALYSRISSRDQSHASQLPDLERWVEVNNEPAIWFKDTFTGRTMNRPGMDKLMKASEHRSLTESLFGDWIDLVERQKACANYLTSLFFMEYILSA